MIAVCSNKPRPSVQCGSRGFMKTAAAAWGRDVYHLLDYRGRTFCGRNASDWLVIGPLEENDLTGDCCERCRKKAMP